MSAAVSSVSVEVVFNNDYLLSEILIRLPAKSLIRFKSVTKHWRSLISDASFCHLHTRHHRTPQTSYLLCSSTSPHWFHFDPTRKNLVPFNFKFDLAYISQSCNGLLLLEIECEYPNLVYYVYNPTTGESRNLLLPINENAKNILCLFLAFDPLKSPHYKAICLRNSKTSSLDYYIEVYDSETREWKRDYKPYRMPPHTYPPGPNWVYSHNFAYSLSPGGVLFCFDTEKLMFRDPFFQDFVAERRLNALWIMESFGHVHVISCDDPENYLVLLEITEKNGEWSSEHLFHFDVKKAATYVCKISCLNVIRGEGEEISLLFHIPDKIMAYHFCERRIEELLDLSTHRLYEDGSLQFGDDCSYQFVESLAPV